jgi:DMSO/TMAO reductase YedYZ molybdopterin-dependent catalytic subunit
LLLLGLAGGQTLGDRLRTTALLAPRGGAYRGDFPVNKTAASRGVSAADVGDSWRLTIVAGSRSASLSRAQLLARPQATARLPIACVEGWSTTQTWTGVRLADLLDVVGAQPGDVEVSSLQRHGAFGQVRLAGNQVADPRSLLALTVNGEALSVDHGYPARVIIPAAPGVHCTKWVREVRFIGGDT